MEWIYGLLALTSACCVHLVLRFLKYSKKVEPLRKLPCYRPRFLIGNLYDFDIVRPRDRQRFISDAYYIRLGVSCLYPKEGLYVCWIGPMPIVFLTKAKTAEVILSSQVLTEKSRLYGSLSEVFGTGLILSGGDKWRQDRKLITPAFHVRVLDEFVDAMNDHATILVDVLKRKSEGRDWLDPQEAVNNCVLDIFLDTFLDLHVKAQTETSELVSLVDRMCYMVIKRIYRPWLCSRIYYLSPEGRKFRKATQNLQSFVDEKIDEKISEYGKKKKSGIGSKRKILLEVLLEQQMNRNELRDQIINFLAAGHHTVGHSLCWVLYLLGLYKDVQSKLVDEISGVFPEGVVEVTKEHLMDLKYMDCVLKESQRLYSTVPDVARVLTENTEIDGYHIPAGTDCVVSIGSIHRDPDIYPKPERFDPDRFLPENCVGRSQYAFIPFSAGPRNCIGQRFAHMEMKIVLCHIISKLTVHSLDPEDKIILVPEIISKPLDPFRIVFGPRYVST